MVGVVDVTGDAVREEYLGTAIPCVYADGILSMAWAPSSAKFYLHRFDSPPMAKPGVATVVVAQIVMPVEGFAATAQFMVRRLTMLKDHDALQREALTEIKRLCEEALASK